MREVARKFTVVFGAMLMIASCGTDDSAPLGNDASAGSDTDAGAAVDASPDSGTATECASPQDCPCFSNYDCPPSHACTSQDDTGDNVFCIEGPRGVGAAGEPCTGEASCASALCVESDSGSFCSGICEDASSCPGVLPTCLYIGFGVDVSICAP